MTKIPTLWHRTLNIVAVLSIVIGVQLARFGFLIIAIPGGIGVMLVLLSFVSFSSFCVIFNFECYYKIFMLLPLDLYEVIIDSGVALINYDLIEISSS